MKPKIMKIHIVILLFLTFVLSLLVVACGTSAENAKTEDTSTVKTDTAKTEQDSFPTQPVKIIATSSSGGGMDTSVRQLQKYWEKYLGESIIVECKPGGATAIGTNIVLGSEPDAYTILATGVPHYQFSMILQDVDYTIDDFVPIGPFVTEAAVIRVKKDAPWDNLTDLIEYAKSQPKGKLKASVSELSSPNFISLKLIEEAAGVEFNIVPFGSGNNSRIALVGGQVDLTNAGVFNSLPIADSTKVIAVHANNNNWPGITDNAKTVNEQLGSDLPQLQTSYGLFVPAKAKEQYPQRYEKLVETLQQALTDPEYLSMLKEAGEEGKSMVQDPTEYDKDMHDLYNELLKYKDMFGESSK